MKDAGTVFNPVWVETFLRLQGVYPLWTKVMLDDGTQGMVVSLNHDDPFRPKVERTRGPGNEPINGGEVVDTSECDADGRYLCNILRSIIPNPWVENSEERSVDALTEEIEIEDLTKPLSSM